MPLRLAIISIVLVLVSLSAMGGDVSTGPAQAALTLDGRTAYVIALAGDAVPAEAAAARELAETLRRITGATFEVRPEQEVAPSAAQILVGAGARVKALVPEQDWAALGADGIVIKTVGRNLVLAGGRPRGTLYAVVQFLEERAGVRWWTPGESTVPQSPTLLLPALNVVYVPPFRYREHYRTSVQRDPLFAARMRENGHSQTQGEELGGHYSILGWVHTFDQLLPPAKYFKDHPEWYSDADNGGKPATAQSRQPAPQASQLCLANEAMRRELIRVALEWIRKHPGAGMISISQNDNRNRCTGEADLALEALEGSSAGPLLHFVNAVAAEIEREFPDFLVETLAYKYTRKPPRHVRPRHNVLVRLCSIEADFSRPLDSESNRDFLADINGWKAIAPRLFVWDYITNFTNVIWPHPNLRVLGPNLRLFAASNVVGVFEQGDAYTNGVGDFVQLRAWLVSHLMWDPRQDPERLTAEFLRGYYGEAAPHLQAYLDLIHEAFQRSGQRLSTFQTDHSYLTLEVMNRATRHFRDAAQAVAADPVLARRVRRERLALDHVWLVRYRAYQQAQRQVDPRHPQIRQRAGAAQAAGPRFGFEGPPDAAAAAAEFVRTAEEFGVEGFQEGASFASYVPHLLRRHRPTAALPAVLRDAALGGEAKDIIDVQEDVFHNLHTGTVIDIVGDAQASDGKAARLTDAGRFRQYVLDEDAAFLESGPWRCYIVARVQPKAGADEAARTAPALSYWLYDAAAKTSRVQGSRTLGELGGSAYHVLDLGRQSFNPAMLFYIAAARNPGVEAVYIDRVLLIREQGVTAR